MGKNSASPWRALLQIGELRPRARPRESIGLTELRLMPALRGTARESLAFLALRSGKLFAGH